MEVTKASTKAHNLISQNITPNHNELIKVNGEQKDSKNLNCRMPLRNKTLQRKTQDLDFSVNKQRMTYVFQIEGKGGISRKELKQLVLLIAQNTSIGKFEKRLNKHDDNKNQIDGVHSNTLKKHFYGERQKDLDNSKAKDCDEGFEKIIFQSNGPLNESELDVKLNDSDCLRSSKQLNIDILKDNNNNNNINSNAYLNRENFNMSNFNLLINSQCSNDTKTNLISNKEIITSKITKNIQKNQNSNDNVSCACLIF